MENKTDNKTNSMNKPITNEYQENSIAKIFCPICYKIPLYSIKIISLSDFVLFHSCKDGKIIEYSIDFNEVNKPFTYNCVYCKKKSEHICLICKYVLCEECSKEHTRIPFVLTEEINTILKRGKNSILEINKSQYSCEKHFLEYKFYCPICKINLCNKCKEEHFHINCPSLFDNKFIFKDIKNPSENFFQKLYQIAKIFYACYDKNVSSGKMTLNILLNMNLANNILSFIQENSIKEGKEIRNNYLDNIDINSFLCKEYGSFDFENNYNNFLIKVYNGNINAYHILNKIIENYKIKYGKNIYNKFILQQSYIASLNNQKDKIINEINFAAIKYDLSETNFILSDCARMINCLKLKNNFFEFCLQLIKMITLKLNYKLDFELRRKVGNIIAKILLRNFNENLKETKKTKKIFALSSEELKKRMNDVTPIKFNKKNRITNQKYISLKNKYKTSLQMLSDEIQKELSNMEKNDLKLVEKEKANIIRFKNLNNNPEEINKATICNLFFFIKWKLGDKFNKQIHNITHSIASILANEIISLENNKKEETGKEKNEDNKTTKIETLEISKPEEENINKENNNIIKKKLCPNKYNYLEIINKNIQIEEQPVIAMDNIFQIEEDDPIIKSTLDEFVNIIKEIKINYCTSSDISIKDSLNLYLDGKKGNILLKRDKACENVNKLIKGFDNLSKRDEKELEQISIFYNKIKSQLDENSSFFCCFMNKIVEELEILCKFFDINKTFEKYQIKKPLNIFKSINIFKFINEEENAEEIYFLILVLSYLFIERKIKEIKEIKNSFDKIDLCGITKNIILKKNIIKKMNEHLSNFDLDSLIFNIWDEFKEDDKIKFSEDKIMNGYMKDYVKNKSEENFKSDLINLIEPYNKKLDLSEKDPQDLFIEPFMIQNNLLDKEDYSNDYF